MFRFLQSLIQRPKIYPKMDEESKEDTYETICSREIQSIGFRQLHTINEHENEDHTFTIRRYFESEY